MASTHLVMGMFFERMAVATALGFLIGFERQWRQRTAGLHTSTIVAIGAALFCSLPQLAGSTDAMRLAAQVVTGVGFLAGGVIIRDGFNVRGVITAATLWATAAVGTLAGSGFEFQAMVGALVIVAVNLVCLPLAAKISQIPRSTEYLETSYTLRARCEESSRQPVRDCIMHEVATSSMALTSLATSGAADGSLDLVAEMTKPGRDDGSGDRLRDRLVKIAGVTSATWEGAERAT